MKKKFLGDYHEDWIGIDTENSTDETINQQLIADNTRPLDIHIWRLSTKAYALDEITQDLPYTKRSIKANSFSEAFSSINTEIKDSAVIQIMIFNFTNTCLFYWDAIKGLIIPQISDIPKIRFFKSRKNWLKARPERINKSEKEKAKLKIKILRARKKRKK